MLTRTTWITTCIIFRNISDFRGRPINLYIKNSCYHITSSSVAVINSLDPHKLTNNTENSFTRIYFHIPDTFTSRFSDQKTNLSECFNNRIAGNNVLLLSHLQKDYIIDIFNKMTQCKDNKHNHFGVNLLFDTYGYTAFNLY